MTGVAVLVPVLRRPQNVAPLLTSIAAVTPGPYRVVFIADPDDHQEIEAIDHAGGQLLRAGGNYARKINLAIRRTTEPLVFLAADDLDFHRGWLEAARARIDDGAQVVGVNDLIDRRPARRGHATHFLMTRGYAERPTIDGRPGPLFAGYAHNFVDDELIATAIRRGVYAYEPGAIVAHQHPMNGTAADDETYRKGREPFGRDRRIFRRRSRLWR